MNPNPDDVPNGEPKELAFTRETLNASAAELQVKTIEEKREDTRQGVAIGLLISLGLVIVGWTVVGVLGDSGDINAAGDALRTAFTGLLGLTGTVVGFYFGGGNKQ